MQTFPLYAPYSFKPKALENGRLYIESPSILCVYLFDEQSVEVVRRTLNFYTIISDICINQGGKLHIDFSSLESFTAAASVLLFAEITRVQLALDISDVITFTSPASPKMQKLFITSGLFKAIKPGGSRKLASLFDDDHPYQSGTDPNKFLVSAIINLKKQGLELSKPETRVISKGIQEAMLNVMHHAYQHQQNSKSGIGNRWWQLSMCNPLTKKVSFIIYDKGLSIPKSISSTVTQSFSDADCIEHAFKKGTTRYTDLPTRGKGSEDIKDVTKIKDNSKLLVYSGLGMYYLNSEDSMVVKSELPSNINGTMIEWLIPYE